MGITVRKVEIPSAASLSDFDWGRQAGSRLNCSLVSALQAMKTKENLCGY
jgi:hypothetical protein